MAPPNFKSQVRAHRRRRAFADFRRRVWIGRWFLLKTAAAVILAYFVSKWLAG
jgi:hypothetical protein